MKHVICVLNQPPVDAILAKTSTHGRDIGVRTNWGGASVDKTQQEYLGNDKQECQFSLWCDACSYWYTRKTSPVGHMYSKRSGLSTHRQFALNATRLIIGSHVLQECIEGEMCRQFHDETLTLEELNVIAAIQHACRASRANSQRVSLLQMCASSYRVFKSACKSDERFWEIKKYLRYDVKSTAEFECFELTVNSKHSNPKW